MNSISAVRVHAALAVVSLAAAPVGAQTTTVLTLTGDTNTANLVQAADGTIYGVTRPSSANATTNGTVFKLQPDGTGYQVVHAFTGGASGARLPDYAFILGRDGVFFGTSQFGGTDSGGMLYRVNIDGSGFALLRSFTGHDRPTVTQDAGTPLGGLVHATDGLLYGAASKGTATSTNNADRNGVIYRIAPDGSGYRLIFSFDGSPSYSNGIGPNSLIQGRDGRLYGTTTGGGASGLASGRGTVFALRPDGTGFTVLRSFNNVTPALEPSSPLVHAADGFLYGTTRGGSIYRLLPDGSGFETIATFPTTTPARGLEPAGAIFQGRDGSLYGRTNSGGSSNQGVLYKVRTDGTGFRVLANFTTARSPYFNGLIQGADGALYATTATTIIRVVETPALEITEQPRSQTVAAGGSVTFTVTATGATTYQWRRNGTNIAGATSASYTLSNLTTAANATYSVVVGNGNAADSVTSDGAVLLVAAPNPGRLINLSVRTGAGSGAETLIAGFVVGGTGSKQVLVRAIGPMLGTFGVTGVLADPRLGLYSGTTETATNSGWGGSAAMTAAFDSVGAFRLTPPTSRDAALLSTLAAGAYSAQVTSSSGGTGVALVEAYDADAANSGTRFINLSARTLAGTGAQTLIAGFVLSGNVPRTLLIRGIGPTLGAFGVTGALANPRLELRNAANAVVATNGGWAGAPALSAAFAQVGAFALPVNSGDAALLVSLTPGNYTAQVAGAGGTTGVALVEVYEVP